MSKRILILFAHPLFEKSRINRELVKAMRHHSHLSFHDLYELYPDFNIDVQHEKKLLLNHDVYLWHHPVYWYGCPPLMKQWMDMVLEAGWAYGPGGNALKGKFVMQVVSTGGAATAYSEEGSHRHTLREFFLPFERSVSLCGMHYLPPFVIHGSHRLSPVEITKHSGELKTLLSWLTRDTSHIQDLLNFHYANEFIQKQLKYEQ